MGGKVGHEEKIPTWLYFNLTEKKEKTDGGGVKRREIALSKPSSQAGRGQYKN